MAPSGSLKGWPEVWGSLPKHCQHAYTKLCDNVDLNRAQVNSGSGPSPVFFSYHSRRENRIVWQYNLERRDHREKFMVFGNSPAPTKIFENRGGILTLTKESRPPLDSLLARVVVGLLRKRGEGQTQPNSIAPLKDTIVVSEIFSWLDSSTLHLRNIHHTRQGKDM